MESILIVFTILTTTLLAGIFLAFSVAVNGGLAKLDDGAYLHAMQNINRVILNPLFMIIFMAPVIALPLTMLLYGGSFGSSTFILYALASAAYIIGTFGITAAGNVPLNDRLEKFVINDASADDQAEMRRAYEKPWNRLHTVRTGFAVVSATLLITAVIS